MDILYTNLITMPLDKEDTDACKPNEDDKNNKDSTLLRSGLTGSNKSGSGRPRSSPGHDLMQRLCLLNPQFASATLEDYIRPVVREEDVILEIECGTNAAIMYLSR